MTEPVSWLLIEPGWTAQTGDGKDAGTVHEVLGDANAGIFDGLVVSTGLLKRRRYVPAEQVEEIVEGRVRLSLSSAELERLDEYEAR